MDDFDAIFPVIFLALTLAALVVMVFFGLLS